jgi:hypothetical protein
MRPFRFSLFIFLGISVLQQINAQAAVPNLKVDLSRLGVLPATFQSSVTNNPSFSNFRYIMAPKHTHSNEWRRSILSNPDLFSSTPFAKYGGAPAPMPLLNQGNVIQFDAYQYQSYMSSTVWPAVQYEQPGQFDE